MVDRETEMTLGSLGVALVLDNRAVIITYIIATVAICFIRSV